MDYGLIFYLFQIWSSPDVNWWTGVVWIIVMFLSAVWTLILTAPIHCRGYIAETVMQCYISPNLMKIQPLHLHHFEQMFISGWTIPLIKTYCTSKEACQWRSKKPEAERLKPIRDESPETLHCSCYCQWSQVAVRSNRAPRRGLYKVEISLVLLQLAHISLSLCWAI